MPEPLATLTDRLYADYQPGLTHAEIAQVIEQCRADTDADRQRARAAQNALTAATQRGEGRSQVDAALTLLPTVPRRADNLAQHATELNDEQHRIIRQKAANASDKALALLDLAKHFVMTAGGHGGVHWVSCGK